MHSYISSSERRVVEAPWGIIFPVVALLVCTFIASMEWRLSGLGYRKTAQDSAHRWAIQRARADALGEKALILIGASRIQLGIDTAQMRADSGVETVQLAVDGSSFVPVLRNLSEDQSIKGTVIIDFYPGAIKEALSEGGGAETAIIRQYQEERRGFRFSSNRIEKSLADDVHQDFRSYADGATPLLSLLGRILPAQKSEQYLTTNPDRSRVADYRVVPMPRSYFVRTLREMGAAGTINLDAPDAERRIREKIQGLTAYDNSSFIEGTSYVESLMKKIEARGGRVLLVKMPTSGFVRDIEMKRFPDDKFLNVFEQMTGRHVLVAKQNAALQGFDCPDGSHLDMRDRTAFTAALDKVLGL